MPKYCGVGIGEAAGVELAADLVDRCRVNVGTIRGRPARCLARAVKGQARCRLRAVGGAEVS